MVTDADYDPQYLKLIDSTTLTEFDKRWFALERKGKVDMFGGGEYREGLATWLNRRLARLDEEQPRVMEIIDVLAHIQFNLSRPA